MPWPWACLVLGAGTLSAAACSGGEIGDASPRAPGASVETPGLEPGVSGQSPGVDPGVDPGPNAPNPPNAVAFAPAPAALRRLTVEQYRNSVADALGTSVASTTELEGDTAQNGFFAIGAARATISPAAAEKFEAAAYEAAAQALALARRAAFVGCTPAGTTDPACAKKLVEKLGARLFRRPLTAAESSRWVGVAETAAMRLNDFHAGLEFAVAGLLQSPNFLFRVELGEPDPANPSRLRYTDYELASRLSYTLWNTTPDETLLDAAARGELTASQGLAREATRLIADARAQAALDDFHSERLGLSELTQLSKAEEVHAKVDDALRSAMRDDVLRTFAEYARPGQDFLALLDTRTAFVTPALAEIYGVAAGSGSGLSKVSLPDSAKRVGLLGKPAFLAMNAHSSETSPTLRGKYIRERVLCESIGAPPPNVVTVLEPPDPNAPTMRDRLAMHAKNAVCASCHTAMDPLGLALEHFDAVGRYRETDHGHALDVTGNLDGEPFDGALELAQVLRDDPRTAACIARQLYRYATAHVETDGEAPAIDALITAFESSGHDFEALLTQVVQSDGFRYAALSEEAP